MYPPRWTALKDALSDLWAFEIMYRGKLKNEFFQYWRTLTEGDAIPRSTLSPRFSLRFV